MNSKPVRSRFFWFALAGGCWILLVYGVGIRSCLTRGMIVGIPLAVNYRSGGWFVSGLPTTGPNAGILKKGDQLVSVDGDGRARRIGPDTFTHFLKAGARTDWGVLRDGIEQHVLLTMESFPAAGTFPFVARFFLVSVSFLVMGMLMGLVRPEDPLTRVGCVAGLWTAWRMFAYAMAPFRFGATGFEIVSYGMEAALAPMVLPLGYNFFRLLAGIPAERFWTWLQIVFYAVCGAAAALDLTVGLSWLQGRESTIRLLDQETMHLLWVTVIPELNLFLVVPLAICAVILRGYLVNRDPTHRRRLRWVVIGAVAAVGPQVGMNLAAMLGIRFPLTQAQTNSFSILIPVTLAYAVVKHQVMGVQVVVRQGVRYLLARNVLTAALILPMAALVLPFVRHPELSISEILRRHPIYFNLSLAAAAAASLKYRRQMQAWLDRRFFRETYNEERILRGLIERVAATPTLAEISRIVSQEVEAALHPRSIHVYYRENPASGLTLGYSSSGPAGLPLPRDSSVFAILESSKEAIDYPCAGLEGERECLDALEPRLIVPIVGRRPQLAGLLLLGEKKSEEPYTQTDKNLLQALAGQVALVCENVWLQERVEEEGRIRCEVLAKLDESGVNLVRECPHCGACYDGAAATCPADGAALTVMLPVERVIDRRYRLESRIGRGGMGAVYDATDLRLNRNVALKVMVGSLFGNHAALRRFEREARATASLVHPNIVAIHDYGTVAPEGAYLVMERVAGVTWRSELEKRGALDPDTAARWFDQLLSGLEAAHTAGIVHRDLKPDNVLVDNDRIKILDFGLAKMRQSGESGTQSMTAPGTVLGTLGYMAPEQLMGRSADERSDLFSAGVMAFEAITGKQLFRGGYSEVLAAMLREDAHLAGNGPAVARLNAVVCRCLAPDPERRYQSAGEMRRELASALAACPAIGTAQEHGPDSGQMDTRSLGA